MMLLRCFFMSMACLLLAGCTNIPPKSKAEMLEIRLATLPPEPMHVIEAMLASAPISLSVGSSCNAESGNMTFGTYLSNFLVEFNDPDGRNYVQVEIVPEERTDRHGWLANVWLGKSQGEEVWKWGISFFIHKPDGLVDPKSYRCIGAG